MTDLHPAGGPVAATLVPAAAGGVWDAVVIGAGPAGGAAALALARAGRRVLLVERHDLPRPKVCGSCLSARAMTELAALGLRPAVEAVAVPIEAVRLVAGGRAARIARSTGLTLSRDALDPLLVRAAVAAGADYLPRLAVREVEAGPEGVVVRGHHDAAGPIALAARSVVVAAGLADSIRCATPGRTALRESAADRRIAARSRIGLGAILPADSSDVPAGELVMATAAAGYVGIVRLEDGRLDVAAAVDRRTLAEATPAQAIETVLAEAWGAARLPVDRARLTMAAVRATPALTRQAAVTAEGFGRVLRVGDAAGYVEPFTGEGIGWALAGGRLVAAAIVTAGDAGVAGAAYARGYRTALRGPHARCRLVAHAVRHPQLVAGLVRAGGALPRVAAGVLPWVTGGAPLP